MNIKETANKVRKHIKKHKKAYIIGAVTVVGTVAAVVITKKVVNVRTAAKITKKLEQMSAEGRKFYSSGTAKAVVGLHPEEAEAYNRVITKIREILPANGIIHSDGRPGFSVTLDPKVVGDGVILVEDIALEDLKIWGGINKALALTSRYYKLPLGNDLEYLQLAEKINSVI